ncbi:FAR1-related sequence 1 [Actinidia rufa]|uniref:Protein FAR1-RELATED SEQUENCE n=1 Tax=Actinidia rufa TaxID=165716 RepID=A0A7J0DXM6_9ERIC|nr:FAR1-related sequence 1 [Actinidia rufa]
MVMRGIDLEQPSGEHHKEDSGPHVNVNNDAPGVHNSDGATASKNSERDKENTGPNLSGCTSNSKHKVHAADGVAVNSHRNIEPNDGMEFESKEDAFSFYKEYAKSVGFAAIIKASRRSRITGNFIDAKFVCTRYGSKRESTTSETLEPVPNADRTESIPLKKKRGRMSRSWSKTDCKACMHVKRSQYGRWVVRTFIKEHNHEIFPDQAYYFRGHRNIDLGNSNVDALHAIRARTKRMFVTMSRQSGGPKKVRMSPTERSESISSIFDKYMQRKTTLKEFLDQCKAILQDKCEEEAKADFETWHKQPGLKSPSPFGKQMATIYTHAIFKKFQVEVLGVVACHPKKESGDGANITFKAFKLGDEGSLSQESYNIAFNALAETLKKCESVNNSIQNVLEPGSPSAHALHEFEDGNQGKISRKTNNKSIIARKGQVQSEPEIITMGLHDSWQQMGHSNLQVPTLDCSYEMQESTQGTEQLNSRVPALDGFFGTQQIVQGMGQLNSMAPSRDDYFGNPHSMQGLLPFMMAITFLNIGCMDWGTYSLGHKVFKVVSTFKTVCRTWTSLILDPHRCREEWGYVQR